MAYALNYQSHRAGKSTNRRTDSATSEPVYQTAKLYADIAFDAAVKLAETLAPDHPADAEALSEEEQFQILFIAAQTLSPWEWDDPNALEALYKLALKYRPEAADPAYRIRAKQLRQSQKYVPDMSVTPASPEFRDQMKRMGVPDGA